jgi:hypothetical protein
MSGKHWAYAYMASILLGILFVLIGIPVLFVKPQPCNSSNPYGICPPSGPYGEAGPFLDSSTCHALNVEFQIKNNCLLNCSGCNDASNYYPLPNKCSTYSKFFNLTDNNNLINQTFFNDYNNFNEPCDNGFTCCTPPVCDKCLVCTNGDCNYIDCNCTCQSINNQLCFETCDPDIILNFDLYIDVINFDQFQFTYEDQQYSIPHNAINDGATLLVPKISRNFNNDYATASKYYNGVKMSCNLDIMFNVNQEYSMADLNNVYSFT